MPLEVYLGAAVGLIILVLLASLLRPRPSNRRVMQKSSDTDLAMQLSRIATALEALVTHLGASPARFEQAPIASPPRVVQPAAPVRKAPDQPAPLQKTPEQPQPPQKVPESAPAEQKAPEATATEQAKTEEPAERHVNLSMFGR